MSRRKPGKGRRGSALLEFTLLGIPVIFLFTSVVTASIDMWQFFTLSYSVEMTARYAVMHGATCGANGNTCQVTRDDVATFFRQQAIALEGGRTRLVLTDGSGSVDCNPVTSNTCAGNTTKFPATSNNSVGADLTVKAYYAVTNPIAMFWPGSNSLGSGSFTVAATSTQRILY